VILAFTVYGLPQSKGSMKPRIVRTKDGRQIPIVTDSNRGVRSWEQLIKAAASQTIATFPHNDWRLFALGVRLSIAFYLPRPQKYDAPKYRGAFVPHCTAPDLDKLARAVLDALTAIVYHDDKQVTELVAAKYYAIDTAARVDIRAEDALQPGAIPPPPRELPLFAPLDRQPQSTEGSRP
jgi:Holliday junction resolvase RusA-like endonuclease